MKQTSHRFSMLLALIFLLPLTAKSQVGINTTSPLAMLHVVEAGAANGPIYSEITSAASLWSAVEAFNPNVAGGAGVIAGGTTGVYGQGLTGIYGAGVVGVYGLPFNAFTDWAGYFDGDVFIGGAITNPSDARIKSNIRGFDNALGTIKNLRPVVYDKEITIKKPELNLETHMPLRKIEDQTLRTVDEYGLIAQDVEKILPQLVTEKSIHVDYPNLKSIKGVNYTGLIPILVKAVQEQQDMIEAQQERIAKLEAKLADKKD